MTETVNYLVRPAAFTTLMPPQCFAKAKLSGMLVSYKTLANYRSKVRGDRDTRLLEALTAPGLVQTRPLLVLLPCERIL